MLWIFPYEDVNKNSRVIIYGAGDVGSSFVKQITCDCFCDIVAVVDKGYADKNDVCGHKISPPGKIKNIEFDKIIVGVARKEDRQSIKNTILSLGIDEKKIVSKGYNCKPEPVEVCAIRTVFDVLGIDNPSYIDAGACHPHLASNTMPFYEKGSRGINVEANVALKKEFDVYRPEDINLFVGLAKEPGEMIFYKSNDPYLNTLSKDAIKWHENHHNATYDSGIRIEVTTLNNIIDKYNNGVFPDFLDIDIEGMDEEVLRHVDFSNSSPILICTEGYMPEFNQFLMNKKCEGDGYMPYCRLGCNSIYLRKDIYPKILSI